MPVFKPGFRPRLIREIEIEIWPRPLPEPIGFDNIPDGTVINTYHQNVTLSFVPQSQPIYARTGYNSASTPNLITIVPPPYIWTAFDAQSGAIKATFNQLQRTVSIDARPMISPENLLQVRNKPFMEVYDSSDVIIAKILYPLDYGTTGWGEWRTLSFHSDSNNIKYILFSSQASQGGANVYSDFDNLYFAVPQKIKVPWFNLDDLIKEPLVNIPLDFDKPSKPTISTENNEIVKKIPAKNKRKQNK